MNPHTSHSASPLSLFNSIRLNGLLIRQITWRHIVGLYKGSVLGIGWSFLIPLIMLGVYTFVFSTIFKARWGLGSAESKADFALILFVGLIVHTLFADVVNRAPKLILENINYVKKVIFPLEILSITSLGSAAFHALISFFVLLLAFFILKGFMNWTAVYIIFTIFPLLPLTLGLGWLLASLGVYLRDIGQIISILSTMALFLAPIFYPRSALPEAYQPLLLLNPLTFPVEQTREVIIFGHAPNWMGLFIYLCISLIICWFGYWWFQKTRKGFADVI